MRSSIRYSLVAVATVALLTIGFVTFRARLEQKVQAQVPAGCTPGVVPSKTNLCLVISSFRENGPAGSTDEFVEIFNASTVAVTVSTLSDDPVTAANGIGVFASAGQGFNGPPTSFGQAANVASLACWIPGGAVIPGRGWWLCGGTGYTLSTRGNNGGSSHSVPDGIIGTGNATGATVDLPNDAGLALLNLGSNIVTQCPINPVGCPTGFNFSGGTGVAIVLDKVGFDPWGSGSRSNTGPGVYPGNIYPSLASQYCEGKCLAPVGDATIITQAPGVLCPGTVGPSNPTYNGTATPTAAITSFPVVDGGPVLKADGDPTTVRICYGESGQYKLERRRTLPNTALNTSGPIHRDTGNNGDDFILDAPNPSTANVGNSVTGVPLVTSVLGAAAPHNRFAPPVIGDLTITQAPFDTGSQLGPRNAERRYALDPLINGTNNDPLGTFILRLKFTNNSVAGVSGIRFRIDDISTLCGTQSGSTSVVATQEARNLRVPNNSTTPPASSPTPSCQGEGSDAGGVFTALIKGVNHYGEIVSDSGGTLRLVNGSVLEDVQVSGAVPSFPTPAPAATLAPGALQPFGGGSNSSWVTNTQVISGLPAAGTASNVNNNLSANGVDDGTGTFATAIGGVGGTLRIAFKFGVVKSGRFKVLIGREAAGPSPLP